MICPDDGSDLSEEATGIYACRRCNGRAVARSAFAATHRDVENILEPEHDPDSGAFARERSCPRCRGNMMPLRLGIQLCWVDWCGACGILWFEKLDGYIVERLRKRVALERVIQEMPSNRAFEHGERRCT